MRLLLDTHTLLWWFLDDPRLGDAARQELGNKDNRVYVSAASAFEIATKHRIGKLPEAKELLDDFNTPLSEDGFEQLAISNSDGVTAGALPGPHKDPWDRMLIAQALDHDLTIVSNETPFDAYGVTRLW